MILDLTPAEQRVIARLRSIKADDQGHGYGTLRVEVADGKEVFIKPEISEAVAA